MPQLRQMKYIVYKLHTFCQLAEQGSQITIKDTVGFCEQPFKKSLQ